MLIVLKYLLFQKSGHMVQAYTPPPPYPMENTTVTGSSTLLPIHLLKESLYTELKYWTKTGAYKVNENNHTADVQGDHSQYTVLEITISHDRYPDIMLKIVNIKIKFDYIFN